MKYQGLIVNLQLIAMASSHFRIKAFGSKDKSLD